MNIFGDKSIKRGDLAMVVRDCCGRYLGTPLTVANVLRINEPSIALCDTCKREYSNIDLVKVDSPTRLVFAPLFWLKKIDPPAIPETTDEREVLHA